MVIYYDTIENFIKDIKNKLNKSVELNKLKNEIIVGLQKIKYKEIDVDLRSFSKPFFVENEIELDIEMCDEKCNKRNKNNLQ